MRCVQGPDKSWRWIESRTDTAEAGAAVHCGRDLAELHVISKKGMVFCLRQLKTTQVVVVGRCWQCPLPSSGGPMANRSAGEASHHLPPTTTTRLYAQNTRGGTLPFLVATLFASYSLLLTEMRCDSGEEAWRGLFLCPPAEFAHAGGLLKITSPQGDGGTVKYR